MPAQKAIENYGYRLMEAWNETPIRQMWLMAGLLWMSIKKNVNNYGFGDGLILVPNARQNNGNVGGNNFAAVTELVTTPKGNTFGVPMGEAWGRSRDSWYDQDMAPANATINNQSGVEETMLATSQGFHRAMSWKVWEKGDGVSGKLDGVLDIAQNKISFKNRQCFYRYEVGDRLYLAAARGVGDAQAVVRSGTVTLASASEATYSFTTEEADISAAIPGAVNTDYVVKYVDAGGTRPTLFGIPKWIPARESEAATTVFNVDRSIDTARLAGRRIPLVGTERVVTVLNRMAVKAANASMPIDSIYLPLTLSEELQDEGEAKNIHWREAEKGSFDPATLRFGSGAYVFEHPALKKPWKLKFDKDLVDIEVSHDEDRTIYGLVERDIEVVCPGKTKISWQARTGEGVWIQLEQETARLASYGGHLQMTVANQGHQMVASPFAAL